MKRRVTIGLLLLFVGWWWLADPTVKTNVGVSFEYEVRYAGGADEDAELPMLVALHGNGDNPGHFYGTALDQLTFPSRIVLLQGPLSQGMGYAWPWKSDDFKLHGAAVSDAVTTLAAKFPTLDKPILMGFSGGGMMAYYQSLKFGDHYSYIFPISGQLSKRLLGDDALIVEAEVLAYHGTDDQVIAIDGGREAVRLLQNAGGIVLMTEFKGGHLGIFQSMKSEITNTIVERMQRIEDAYE